MASVRETPAGESCTPRIMLAVEPAAVGTDLDMVDQLLQRCWRELGMTDLNAKLTDVVRLLELKNKLHPHSGAEKVFWRLIDDIRGEVLTDYGDDSAAMLSDGATEGDDV